jgi:rubrerythrin
MTQLPQNEPEEDIESPPVTLEWVLRKAIQKEVASWLLYNNLSRKLEQPAAREACRNLALKEKEHERRLGQYLDGEIESGALDGCQVLDYKIAEHLEQPSVYPDMKPADVFLLAARREKAAHDLYQALAQLHPPGKARDLLEELACEEMEHKNQVELLYNEVAFPQTDGG